MSSLHFLALLLALGLCLHAEGRRTLTQNMEMDKKLAEGSLDSVTKVMVNLTSSLHVCDDKFLSITIDSGQVHRKWAGFDFGSSKLKNMAAALSPINIRIGGTDADYLVFDPSNTDDQLDVKYQAPLKKDGDSFGSDSMQVTFSQFTMSASVWRNMTSFFSAVGWDLMFDFNVFLRKGDVWNSTNAELLLNYSSAMGIPIPSFQLGNEPNLFPKHNVTIMPEQIAKDFKTLNSVLAKYPMYKNSGVYGPDVTHLDDVRSAKYLRGFIAAGGADFVTEIALHYYYMDGETAKAEDFLQVETLDRFKQEIDKAYNITSAASRPVKLRFTETSSCYHGGAPGLSDRYIAGFLWLDKLGLGAKYGITHVFRQAFYGGNYGLLSEKLDPNPDYFLSVLFKRLTTGPVFNVSVEPDSSHVRVYAHCARRDRYPVGALTLYYLNMNESPVTLSMDQFQGKDLDLFLLTPGDSDGLTSSYVKLNGEKLVLQNDMLPLLPPKTHQGDVAVEGQSFGFIVIPNASVSLCIVPKN